jgi:hypothetical protein
VIRKRRYLLLALVALTVPLPAFGVSSGGTPGLSVSASLDQCGVASTSVVCKFDASYNEVSGAEYYTASVTAPDGSVVDYGNVAPGATSLWVPYVGNGTYTISISAWGEPTDNTNKPKPIATGTVSAGGSTQSTSAPGAKNSGSGHPDSSGASSAGAPGQQDSSRTSAGSGPQLSDPSTTTTTPTTTTPSDPPPDTCVPQTDPPPPPTTTPETTTSGTTSTSPGMSGVSPAAASSMSTSGELPSTTTEQPCPDGTTPKPSPDGPCCPTPAPAAG